jgi:hypothetical protein
MNKLLFATLFALAWTQVRAEDPLKCDCHWEIYVGLSTSGSSFLVSAANVGGVMWGAGFNPTDSLLGESFEVSWNSIFASRGIDWPYGFDFINSISLPEVCCTRLNSSRYLPHGLFKITYYDELPGYSIYIDLRDDRYNHNNLIGDMWLRYNTTTSQFEYSYYSESWNTYDPGDTIRIWDYAPGTHSTGLFQPTAPSDLSATPYNWNPRLTWTASSGYVTGYRVYRNVGSGYVNIANTTGTAYVDYDITWTGDNDNTRDVQYYVKAINNSTESVMSNTIQILIDPRIQKRQAPGTESLKQTELHANYPNPFNSDTRISFGLPEKSHVVVIVYNILGQRVRKLKDADLLEGEHELVWDSRREDGMPVPTGTYILELSTASTRSRLRMNVLK